MNDPRGIAVLTLRQDPDFFVDGVRPALTSGPFDGARRSSRDFTMFGRTYAIGYEPDLAGHPDRPAAADGAQPGLALGRLVPAAAQRPLRAAAARRAAHDPRRARRHRHGVRRRRLRARRPPGLPRPRPRRQRLRHRPDRQGRCSRCRPSSSRCARRSRPRSTSIASGRSSSAGRSGRRSLDERTGGPARCRPPVGSACVPFPVGAA